MATILLTDGQQRKTLSAARSLGRAGHRVLVAEVTRWATARFSRYVAKGLVCPDPATEPQRFRHWLNRTVVAEQVDCVLPMDDHTTELVIQAAARLGAAVLVPTPAQFALARNKGATMTLAREAGVRAPWSAQWAPPSAVADADLEAWLTGQAEGAEWPLVVKARHGSGARGIRPVANLFELLQAYREIHAVDPHPLVQACIPQGRKFDVCLLFDRSGHLVTSFVQEELRGYPLWGGPSTLQESVERPDLVDLALRLLAPIGWCGPVEVEFMEDPRTGEPVLMEINPRFWASVDLAVRCGVDFPRFTVELALGVVPDAPKEYPVGRRCRWLLPGDLLHFIANPKRLHMNPPFFKTIDSRTHDDILSLDDPLPTLGFCLASLRYSLDFKMWRMILR
jgi:predicted ATP-grasp superfamily ATP-dependent carboligase